MEFWWVNQNQTHQFEVPGGFLWSPKTRADGARNPFYDSMIEVQPGDIVFSFYDTFIQAIGIVQKRAVTAPKPNFESIGSNWKNEGWFVEIEFENLENPFQPKLFMDQIGPLLPDKYAPLQANGNGIQNLYLTRIPEDLGKLLVEIAKAPLIQLQTELSPVQDYDSDYEIELEIRSKSIEGDLEKIQLVKSRKGQGVFRANVRLIEDHCRITGISNPKHLVASHIKPWRSSDNEEKLDGYNGLLLSPHVDHLFDKGFISFENGGHLIVSKELNPQVLEKWAISRTFDAGEFKKGHHKYLEYHREVIFK